MVRFGDLRSARADAADAAQADDVLRVGIAQNASAIARGGLISEELDFENWPAMAIYRAQALNHLVLHVDIVGTTGVMVVSRRPLEVAGIVVDSDAGQLDSNATSIEGISRLTSFSFAAAGERVLLESRMNHKLAVRSVDISTKVEQPPLIFVTAAIVAIVAFTDPRRYCLKELAAHCGQLRKG